MNSVTRMLSLAMLFGIGLVACGEGDSGSASAPAAPTASQDESSNDATANKFKHDQDVIYQDEIYANWPYN